MAALYDEIDDVRYVARRRDETEWTTQALKNSDLSQIGNFKVKVYTNTKERKVSFTQDGQSLEFLFLKMELTSTDQLKATLKRASEATGTKEKSEITDAFTETLIKNLYRGEKISTEEILLGGQPMSLGNYQFRSVRLLNVYSGFWKFILPNKSNLLYKE